MRRQTLYQWILPASIGVLAFLVVLMGSRERKGNALPISAVDKLSRGLTASEGEAQEYRKFVLEILRTRESQPERTQKSGCGSFTRWTPGIDYRKWNA